MLRARSMLRFGPAAAAVAAGLALVGCSPDQLGTAAQVGDQTIGISQVQDTTAALLGTVQPGEQAPPQPQAIVLEGLIRQKLIDELARRKNVTVSESELDAAAQASGAPQNLSPAVLDWLRAVNRMSLQERKIVEASGASPQDPSAGAALQAEFAAMTEALDIQVNPRYGTFNPAEQNLEPLVSGGLSSQAPSPASSEEPLQGG